MWPRPIFVLHSRSAPISQCMILPPIFISQSASFVFLGSVQQLPLLQSCLCFLSPPTLPSPSASFSFIHILLPQQQQTQSSHRAGALPRYNLSLCFYLHSSSFPSSGDFTFISCFFHPALLPLSVLVPSCLFLFFFLRSCAPHCSLSSSQIHLSTGSLFLSFSLSPSCFFLFPPTKSCNEV